MVMSSDNSGVSIFELPSLESSLCFGFKSSPLGFRFSQSMSVCLSYHPLENAAFSSGASASNCCRSDVLNTNC